MPVTLRLAALILSSTIVRSIMVSLPLEIREFMRYSQTALPALKISISMGTAPGCVPKSITATVAPGSIFAAEQGTNTLNANRIVIRNFFIAITRLLFGKSSD